ncbi:MAG: PKD domain-containing protein [Chitinophagales bacterium]|nr:PKD domain-containing protein [Chitinophagales bacterium]
MCEGNQIQFTNYGNPAATYVWYFDDGNTSSQYSPAHTYAQSGVYDVTLIITDTTTCNVHDTLTKTFHVWEQPVAMFYTTSDTFKFENPVSFFNQSTDYEQLFWDFGDGQLTTEENPTHIYYTIGWHTVCLTAVNGICTDTFCKRIYIRFTKMIGVPNAFSPNGDGINDVVKVEGKGIVKLVFRIFNRWGEKVFESTDQSIGWDGYYKGVLQEMDAYAYYVEAELINGENVLLKGNITLLR